MQKGVVIEAGKKWSIVLTPDGQFCKVPSQPGYLEGMEISFSIPIPVSTFSTKRIMSRRWTRGVSAIAACLLLLVLIFPFFSGSQAYAAVTIDINPSLELDVDQNANVIEIQPLNEDGKKVLEQVQWKKHKLDTVALDIIKAAESNGLMNDQNQVIISTTFYKTESADQGQQWDSMLENVSDKVDQGVTVILVDGNKKWFEEAKKQSVPPGSYMLVKQAEQQGVNLQVDDIQKGQWDNLPTVNGVKVIHPKKSHPKDSSSESPAQVEKDTQPVNGKVDKKEDDQQSDSKVKPKEEQQPSSHSEKEHSEPKSNSHGDDKEKKKIEKTMDDDESYYNHGQQNKVEKHNDHGNSKDEHGNDKDKQDQGKNKRDKD
ncbi:MAG TPA: anti-sigma factor domain-containing protein [Bacillota bacterium]|nr:anti-sigma factor domain-containing protein [Bacillota bacterium]